jgi:hypothetical protein
MARLGRGFPARTVFGRSRTPTEVNPAAETGIARPVRAGKGGTLGRVTESGTAHTIARVLGGDLGLASETGAALPIRQMKSITLQPAVETGMALPFLQDGPPISVGGLRRRWSAGSPRRA